MHTNPDGSVTGPNPYDFSGGINPTCPDGYWLHIDSARAFCWADDQKPDLQKNAGGCPGGCRGTGNPIYPNVGNKYQVELDYRGVGPMPLMLRRYYNSLGNGMNASLGIWRHEYDRTIALVNLPPGWDQSQAVPPLGDAAGTYVSVPVRSYPGPAGDMEAWPSGVFPFGVVLFRPDGKTYRFTQRNGTWTSDADVTDKLAHQTDSNGNIIGWQYINSADDTTETYNAGGRLVSITNRSGMQQILSYGPNGRLSSVTDPFGRTLTFSYGANSITVTDPANQQYQYEFDGPSGNCPVSSCTNLTAVTYPDTRKRVYWYNESNLTGGANLPNALTGITDENAARYATFAYDANGRAISTEHAASVEQFKISYTAPYAQSVITDPLGTNRTSNYAIVLGVVHPSSDSQPAANGSSAASRTYTYDFNGNISSATDWNGNVTCYAYDLSRNLERGRIEGLPAGSDCNAAMNATSMTALARKVSTQWHDTYRLPVMVAEPKRITKLDYDPSGNLLMKTVFNTLDPSGAQGFNAQMYGTSRKWTYTYNSVGQVLTAKGPRTDVDDTTSYAYDPINGNLLSITNALGHVTTLDNYDANGKVGRITDPNGLVTTLTYHARGWLTDKLVTGNGINKLTHYDYDGAGQMKQVTLPDGSTIGYTYDDAHRLTDIADGLGNRIHYTLDAMGNRTKEEVSDPAGNLSRQVSRIYDALNRLQQVTGGTQ